MTNVTARAVAEQLVAEQLGLTVAKVQANMRAEIEFATSQGKQPGQVGATYRMVIDALAQIARGES